MKITSALVFTSVNLDAYRERMGELLTEALALAAWRWLETVLAEIPVWSGASHATFLGLARELHFSATIHPVARSGISYGQRHGEGSLSINKTAGRYLFHYATSLPHLIWNEYHNANIDPDPTLFSRLKKPGPYHFQDKGQRAFHEYATTVRLPSPWRSLAKKTLRVS